MNMESDFLKNLNTKYLYEEFQNGIFDVLSERENIRTAFFKFAKVLGCFENGKLTNFSGVKTNTIIGQKASLFLKSIITDKVIELADFPKYFDSLDEKTNYSSDFLNFLTLQQGKDKYKMLKLLMTFEQNKSGTIPIFISKFNLIRSLKRTLDERGKPSTLSWEQALARFIHVQNYQNITEENADIAELFINSGMLQTVFDMASEARKTADKLKIKKHILNTALKENNIKGELKKLYEQNSEESRSQIGELYNKRFTYEFLDKHDAKNYIPGLFADCCATIGAGDYGKKITLSAVLSDDVQNIIVNDSDGKFIAKATMYVNRESGYAVINEFDINLKYRDGEVITEENKGGWYQSDESDRQKIFETFMRAVKRFVAEYAKQNPVSPITKVNVGMGHNKLKSQLHSFRREQTLLQVPEEYGFNDAEYGQFILFEKSKTNDFENKTAYTH